jgi:excisionase family DNA binding protein
MKGQKAEAREERRTGKRIQVTHVEALPVGVLLYTKVQMATLLQVSVRCVERMMRGGELSYLKLNGRLVRFGLEDVNHLVGKCEVRAGQACDQKSEVGGQKSDSAGQNAENAERKAQGGKQ